jgi:hypothetical protein
VSRTSIRALSTEVGDAAAGDYRARCADAPDGSLEGGAEAVSDARGPQRTPCLGPDGRDHRMPLSVLRGRSNRATMYLTDNHEE